MQPTWRPTCAGDDFGPMRVVWKRLALLIRVRTTRGRVATYSYTVRWMLRTVFAAAQSWHCLFLCKRRRFWYSDRLTYGATAAAAG